MYLSWLLTVGISLVLVYVCYTDIRWRRIPNRAVSLILLLSLFSGCINMPYPSLWLPIIILLLGFIAATMKLMGAGDIKLICALAMGMSVSETADFLLLTAIAGIPVSVICLLYFYFFTLRKNVPVPYAPAICCGYWLQLMV